MVWLFPVSICPWDEPYWNNSKLREIDLLFVLQAEIAILGYLSVLKPVEYNYQGKKQNKAKQPIKLLN